MTKNVSWKNVLVLILVCLIGVGAGSYGMFKVISNKLPSNIEVKLW